MIIDKFIFTHNSETMTAISLEYDGSLKTNGLEFDAIIKNGQEVDVNHSMQESLLLSAEVFYRQIQGRGIIEAG